MAVLQISLTWLCWTLILFKVVLSQPYQLTFSRIEDTAPVTLRCLDTSIGANANINDVKFWLNRTLPDDPDLRERSDVALAPGQMGTELTITFSRGIEGRYTCGQQIDSANVIESSPVLLVSLLPFNLVVDRFVPTFFATTRSQAVIRCPVQPGALVENYFGRWMRNGTTLVEVSEPINGNPQDLIRSDARYDLDRSTFSLIINSVEAEDSDDDYLCTLRVFNPPSTLQQVFNLRTEIIPLSLMVNEAPVILSGPDDVTMALNDDSDNNLPSFTCVIAGIPAPNIIWTYLPNLDSSADEISLTDGASYRIESDVHESDDGRSVSTSTVTFLEPVVTDGGLVQCRTGSPGTTARLSADGLLTIIGEPDHIDVIVSTRGEFLYDVALPVQLQQPVKLNISYVDASRQATSPGRLTIPEYNDTRSILYRELDSGQLPFERYFVRISIVAEFRNRRIEGATFTSAELIDTTMPSAQVVIFGLSGGIATAFLIILVILPCITAVCCCVYHRRKGIRCCRSGSSNVV